MKSDFNTLLILQVDTMKKKNNYIKITMEAKSFNDKRFLLIII